MVRELAKYTVLKTATLYRAGGSIPSPPVSKGGRLRDENLLQKPLKEARMAKLENAPGLNPAGKTLRVQLPLRASKLMWVADQLARQAVWKAAAPSGEFEVQFLGHP